VTRAVERALGAVPFVDSFRFRSAVVGRAGAATGRGMKAKRKEAPRSAGKSASRGGSGRAMLEFARCRPSRTC
jgi:hypothetical protein